MARWKRGLTHVYMDLVGFLTELNWARVAKTMSSVPELADNFHSLSSNFRLLLPKRNNEANEADTNWDDCGREELVTAKTHLLCIFSAFLLHCDATRDMEGNISFFRENFWFFGEEKLEISHWAQISTLPPEETLWGLVEEWRHEASLASGESLVRSRNKLVEKFSNLSAASLSISNIKVKSFFSLSEHSIRYQVWAVRFSLLLYSAKSPTVFHQEFSFLEKQIFE